MTGVEWGRHYGVPKEVIGKLGGAARLNAMTPLGRELLMALVVRRPDGRAVRRAAQRLAMLANEEGRRLRRMRGEVVDLVWLGAVGEPVSRPKPPRSAHSESRWADEAFSPEFERMLAVRKMMRLSERIRKVG